ncbi:MAG: E3 ubiquitin-protein ligase sspH2 [Candidatus Anoxychlamydiales bacterium]|nr:E3 ubiquitin-protein ligase sspH2 [Candidatus Anoxychlamydiales bacterium]
MALSTSSVSIAASASSAFLEDDLDRELKEKEATIQLLHKVIDDFQAFEAIKLIDGIEVSEDQEVYWERNFSDIESKTPQAVNLIFRNWVDTHRIVFADFENCFEGSFLKTLPAAFRIFGEPRDLCGMDCSPIFGESLELSSNNFTIVPSCIPSHFKYITELFLANNNLSGSLSASVRVLSKLKVIDLTGNQLTDAAVLAELPSLEEISVANNELVSMGFINNNTIKGLKKLSIEGNPKLRVPLDLFRKLIDRFRNAHEGTGRIDYEFVYSHSQVPYPDGEAEYQNLCMVRDEEDASAAESSSESSSEEVGNKRKRA